MNAKTYHLCSKVIDDAASGASYQHFVIIPVDAWNDVRHRYTKDKGFDHDADSVSYDALMSLIPNGSLYVSAASLEGIFTGAGHVRDFIVLR